MAEVVIKINGDVKAYQDALKKAAAETENLSSELGKISRTAGLAFAALTAEIGLSVKEFAESEKAANLLTQALQNQGIYSKDLIDSYKEQATELQNLTGISDEAIIGAQTTLQAYLKETQVTKELTEAIANLATAKNIDLASAAQIVGKAIDGNSTALKKMGVEVDDNASKQERLAQVIDGINGKWEGLARASGEGAAGSMAKLKVAFSDLQEEIGARFAPVVEAITKAITKLFIFISQNKALVDFAVSLIAGGAAAAGIITVLGAAGIAFLQLRAAIIAANVATSAMSLSIKALIGATGIGLLVVAITEIALNWNSIWPRMQAVFKAFVDNIGTLGLGLADILKGIFTLKPELIREGFNKAKGAFSEGYDDYTNTVNEKLKEQAEKEKEIEKGKQEDNKKTKKEYAEIQKEEDQLAFEEMLAQNEEFQAMTAEQQAEFRTQNAAMKDEVIANERQANEVIAQQRLKDQIDANNKFLINQQKFGTAYATIYSVMNSEIYKGQKQAFGELAQLQQSSNSTLKSIGKVAAVANIIIKTAESAMNIYAGFSTIPIIGPALGIAGAAAAVAFGAEQVGRVTAAADGGIITGGIRGIDSVPVLAQQGELVSPVQNFNEVIGSVRAAREANRIAEETGFSLGAIAGQNVQVMIGFDSKEASQVLTARQIEDESLGVSQRG